MAIKTDSQLTIDNNTVVTKYDDRYSFTSFLNTFLKDLIDSKESILGNPLTNGQVLSSTTSGVRSWITPASSGGGSVTSVGGTGTVSGLSLSGTVTSTGNLTLGGTLAVIPSNFASQTANTVLAAPNGSSGTPTFRTLVASDIPSITSNATHTGDVTGATALTIANNAVTYAKMQNVTTARIMGRLSAGSGVMEELSGTQATSLLDNFTSTTKGLVPLSGGGTTNFLRADGTWAAPAGGGGGGTVTSVSIATANGIGGSVANSTTTPAITLSLGAITPLSVVASGAISGNEVATTSYFKIIHAINSGGGLYNEVGGVNMMQMGFNNQASYGGVINTTSGRQFFVYDFPTSSYRMGFNSNGDLFVGSSGTVFTARLGNAGNMFKSSAVGIPTIISQGIASQTANLAEFQNSSGTALAAFSSSGNLEFSSGIKGIKHNGVGVLDFAGTAGSTKGLLLSATSASARLETSGHLELQAGGGSNNVRSLSTLDFGSTGAGGSITTAGVATFASLNGTGSRVVEANATGSLTATSRLNKTLYTTTTLVTNTGSAIDYGAYSVPANTLSKNGDAIIYTFAGDKDFGGSSGTVTVTVAGNSSVSQSSYTGSGDQILALQIMIVRTSATTIYVAPIRSDIGGAGNTNYTVSNLTTNTLDINFRISSSGISINGRFAKVNFEPAP